MYSLSVPLKFCFNVFVGSFPCIESFFCAKELCRAHTALFLCFLDILEDKFLDVARVPHVDNIQMTCGLVCAVDADSAYAEQALPERASQADVADAVEEDFLFLQVQDAGLTEETVRREPVFCKTDGKSQMALPVMPDVFHVFSVLFVFVGITIQRAGPAYEAPECLAHQAARYSVPPNDTVPLCSPGL